MWQWREPVPYRDTLLADQSVHRRYENGREEWRWRLDDWRVQWRDNRGATGADELLGNGIVKRTTGSQVLYGREQGYGRTAWSDGTLTANRSSFPGLVGVVLAGAGAGLLLGAIVPPPMMLSAADEAALRQQELQRRANSSDGSSSSGGDGGPSSGSGDGGPSQPGERPDEPTAPATEPAHELGVEVSAFDDIDSDFG